MIHIIYMAAGNSRRFGSNKLLHIWQGKMLYRHTLDMLSDIVSSRKINEDIDYDITLTVIVAGGIFDHDDIIHALELGADGVQIASRFVATKECDASDEYKQAYLDAKEDDVKIIKSPVGMPGRAIRNDFIKRVEKEKQPVDKCYNCMKKCNPNEVPYCITKALVDAVNGDINNGLIFCGANVGRINEMTTVHELMKELVRPTDKKIQDESETHDIQNVYSQRDKMIS